MNGHVIPPPLPVGTDSLHPDEWARLPAALRDRPQWALARSGPDKRPLTVDGRDASSTDPSTWTDFATACRVAAQHGWQIGYMLSADDPLTCIDLDVKADTPASEFERYESIVAQFDSYTERSRSGLGLHIWVEGNIGRGCKRGGVEVYSQERFIICTGDVWQDKPVAARPELLANMVSQMRGADNGAAPLEDQPARESDDEVIARAQRAANWEKFASLARGEWKEQGYSSQSEADLSLISMIAFYSPNNEQCRRIFRRTELGKREKAAKDDRYLNLTLGRIRSRQAVERSRMDAIRIAMEPAIDAGLAEWREKQRFKFKQIGEGEVDLADIRPPSMDLDMMLGSLVHVLAEKPIVVFRDMPAVQMAAPAMASLLTHNQTEVPNKKGEVVEVSTFRLWLASERRMAVYTLTFDPRMGEFCQATDGRLALNLWKPRPHAAPEDWQARVKPFLEHVAYLVPDEAERERFLDWLAHVEQRPGELPHAHYLMIATQQGVGRNWLSSLLACVWSGHVALDYDLKGSLNNGFNGQLSRKLLAVVDEVNEGGTGERWQHSEKLKSMVTTSERFINVKYGLQHSEVNCCRWLLFSNYESALPLSSDDRRWNVIRNPSEPREAGYYASLYGTLRDSQFIASVREFLRVRDIAKFNPGDRAAMNEAKQAVVATSMTHEDEKAAEVVATWPRDLILADHLFEEIYDISPQNSPDANRRWARLGYIAAKVGIERMPKCKDMTLQGRRGWKVWMLREPQRWKGASPPAIEHELFRPDGPLAPPGTP